MEGAIQRVVILGHNGFIGSQVMRAFSENAPADIELIGRSFPELDLTKWDDVATLTDIFDMNTAVVLLSGIKKQMGDTLEIFSQNMEMVVNFCNLLREYPVKRLVYFSSAEVYGEDVPNTSISEETPVHPVSFYGVAKYASEGLLRKVIHSNKDSSLVILRPPLIYGMGDTSRGYGPTGFVWLAANAKEITLWGDGTELREFVSVEDLARVTYHLTFHSYDGVVNVATGQSHSFQEVLGIISRLIDQPLQVNSRPRTKGKVDQGYTNHLLKNLLPDFNFTDLNDGIQKMFTTIRNYS